MLAVRLDEIAPHEEHFSATPLPPATLGISVLEMFASKAVIAPQRECLAIVRPFER
jgi:hypothetical protein